MHYKIEGALKKNRVSFIVGLVLWVFTAMILVLPFTYSVFQASAGELFDLNTFFSSMGETVFNPFRALASVFENGLIGRFLSNLLIFTIFYIIFFFIGVIRSAPKNEYTDIEHGSSDWSQRGEQYRILSKNKGLILAENNYLPIDKRGNVNVLVVGRIGSW